MGTVDEWEKEWRESISQSVRETATVLQTTVGAVRELETTVRGLLEWKRQMDERPERNDMRLNRWSLLAVSIIGILVANSCGFIALVWDVVRTVTGH